MNPFSPPLMNNMQFLEYFRNLKLCPNAPTKCPKCMSKIMLYKNRFYCKNTHCKKSIDIWEGTAMEGFPSLNWNCHYMLLVECACNVTAKATADKYCLPERTVDLVF